MVANRKTRSKPAAGAARTAGQALQKSTSSASENRADEVAEVIRVDAIDADLDSPVESDESAIVQDEVFQDSVVILDAEVVGTAIPSPVAPPVQDTPTATAIETIPAKATQKTKGASVMTEAETPKASAVTTATVPDSTLDVVGIIYSAGERPIGASSMHVFGTILNGRPIEASSLKLFEMLPGDRPVFANEVSYLPGVPGGRPVLVSPPGMMHAELLMGGRPIFSNDDLSDPTGEALMGYID